MHNFISRTVQIQVAFCHAACAPENPADGKAACLAVWLNGKHARHSLGGRIPSLVLAGPITD
jgi:hypothetical protein